jgi:hypothetical protein
MTDKIRGAEQRHHGNRLELLHQAGQQRAPETNEILAVPGPTAGAARSTARTCSAVRSGHQPSARYSFSTPTGGISRAPFGTTAMPGMFTTSPILDSETACRSQAG